jgi:hypothetical protein
LLYTAFGKKLIGFTKPLKCEKCNQTTPHAIREEYTEQNILFIPLPTSHGKIYMFCPVCEKEESLMRWVDLWGQNNAKQSIVEILEDGKEYTKDWLSTQSYKTRESIFKRLNALKAYNLVRYLGG